MSFIRFNFSLPETVNVMYVVGDIHGDISQARSALQIAGVLSYDVADLWTGGETVCLACFCFIQLLIDQFFF